MKQSTNKSSICSKSICPQMLKWNSPIDKWPILVQSIDTLLRPRIIFLFFKQLKKHSRLRILHAQYRTCKQRRRVGNPFRNRLRSFTFVLVNRVCRERNILDVTSQRYITHHSEHTVASRWNLNVRKILVENTLIENRTRNFVFLNESQPSISSNLD